MVCKIFSSQVNGYEFILIVINSVMILGGLVGNVLVCLSVATSSNLKSLVNMLLVNLAISDIIVLMACAPFSILQVRDSNYLCPVQKYFT